MSDLELEGAGVDVEPPEGRRHLRRDHLVKTLRVVDERVRLVVTVTQVLVVILTPTPSLFTCSIRFLTIRTKKILSFLQCWGSGSRTESGSARVWASRIRIQIH